MGAETPSGFSHTLSVILSAPFLKILLQIILDRVTTSCQGALPRTSLKVYDVTVATVFERSICNLEGIMQLSVATECKSRIITFGDLSVVMPICYIPIIRQGKKKKTIPPRRIKLGY